MSAYRCTATGCPLRGLTTTEPHEHVRNRDGSIGYRLHDPRRLPPPPPSLPVITLGSWPQERESARARARALGNALAGGLALALPALLVLAYLAWWA